MCFLLTASIYDKLNYFASLKTQYMD